MFQKVASEVRKIHVTGNYQLKNFLQKDVQIMVMPEDILSEKNVRLQKELVIANKKNFVLDFKFYIGQNPKTFNCLYLKNEVVEKHR